MGEGVLSRQAVGQDAQPDCLWGPWEGHFLFAQCNSQSGGIILAFWKCFVNGVIQMGCIIFMTHSLLRVR